MKTSHAGYLAVCPSHGSRLAVHCTGQPNPASRNTVIIADILLFIQAVTSMTTAAAKEIPGDPVNMEHEALMNPWVTPVSEESGKQTDLAVANFVLTNHDLLCRGVNRIAGALRRIPGINVIRMNAGKRAMTSRCLDHGFANRPPGTHIREFLPDFTCTQPNEVGPGICSLVTWRY